MTEVDQWLPSNRVEGRIDHQKGTRQLVGDENVYYPDSGEGFMGVYICKKWIKLYSLNTVVHYTSIVTPQIGENTQLKDRVFKARSDHSQELARVFV